MQGLRPYLQDENSLSALQRPAAVKAAPLGDLGLGGGARKGTPGFAQGPRKALGNITNRGGGLDAENAAPGKALAAGAAPAQARRALGDITNSSAAGLTAQRPTAQKAAGLEQQQQPAGALAAAAAAAASRADVLAEGGVERLAGKGWEQLERERVAREDAESQQRLAALANYPARRLPNFFPLWAAPSMDDVFKKDALPSPPASPLRSAGPGVLCVPDVGDLSLPDVALSDIDDALSGLDGF